MADVFRADVPRADFEAFIQSLGAVVDEAEVEFDDSGVRSSAVDVANVATVDATIYGDGIEFRVDGSGSAGLNLDLVESLLETLPESEMLTITFTDEGQVELRVDPLAATVSTIDPDSMRPAPDLDLDEFIAYVEIDGGWFASTIETIAQLTNKACFQYEDGDFTIESFGDEPVTFAPVDADIATGESLVQDDSDAVGHADLTVEYLDDFVNVIPSDGIVGLYLGDTYPIELSFNSSDGVAVTFGLAPRVQKDGDHPESVDHA